MDAAKNSSPNIAIVVSDFAMIGPTIKMMVDAKTETRRFILSLVTTFLMLNYAAVSVRAEIDASTPAAAFRAYATALAAGDIAVRDRVVAGPEQMQLLEGQLAYGQVEKYFRQAVIKAFPDAAKVLPAPLEQMLASIEGADVKIIGDTATIQPRNATERIHLKRTGDTWKVDLTTLYSRDQVAEISLFRRALSDVIKNLTEEIEANKFTSFEAVREALEVRVKMYLAIPPAIPPLQPSVPQSSTQPTAQLTTQPIAP
jgi:4-hydroxy-L-threonine phosphate dehydrogenase PdxA